MESTPTQNKNKIQFILTGFGAFGNHVTNPTSILIENILKDKKPFEIPELYDIQSCEVLFVAAQDCDEFYEKIIKVIEKQRKDDNYFQHIILHFGLYSGSKEFNLELLGHNCADFTIPDNRNNKFCNKVIVEKYPLEHHFRTMLPIISIREQLKEKGFKTKLSENPGRYICNYLYYLSLYHGYKNDVPSLFVHFPDFCDIDEKTQRDFVKNLLNLIALEYNK